ncbi:MAG: histidine phosphatase family protein [Candidatus Rokubacteria bacterium]|nr:histidine phosphatase family protein [Candidatus Rokubacteria bacterium]
MNATTIYLLRHGEVVGAETRRLIGHLDVPLSERGERQCAAQARRLAREPIAAVFASDLVRARRSAQIVAAPHGHVPTELVALREMSMGRWDGLTSSEIEARDPGMFEQWMTRLGEFPFPDGESLPDLLGRAWPAFETIVCEYPGRSVAVVAHGGTNRAILCRALGVPLARILAFGQDYGALNVLEFARGAFTLRRLNQSPML